MKQINDIAKGFQMENTGKHHPDCGLLYDDGPDECTCGTAHPLAQMLATAQLMAICAAMGMPS